ncbi:hypothetical protein BDW22DRAFT_1433173 [Trametopsis cervina]|nr:hypothetical protein BDW22DRAFT_1433173 [Trametopsis cervina]
MFSACIEQPLCDETSLSEPPPLPRRRYIDLPPSPGSAPSPPLAPTQHPVSSQPTTAVELHAALRSPDHTSTGAEQILRWDMRQPPSTVLLYVQPNLTSIQEILSAPATFPQLREITIICATLPWPVKVTSQHEGITVRHILEGIYEDLHIPVTSTELVAITASASYVFDALCAAHTERLQWTGTPAETQPGQIRRVDVLLKNYMFAGLRPTAHDTTFVLDVYT